MGVEIQIAQTQDQRAKVNPNDPSAGFLEDKLESSDGSITVAANKCNDKVDLIANGSGGFVESTIKLTVLFSDFTAAASIEYIIPPEFANLPAGTTLVFAKIKHSIAFVGGSVSAIGITIEQTGSTLTHGATVFAAPSDNRSISYANNYQGDANLSHTGTDDLYIQLQTSGDNVNNLTQGSCDIWVVLKTLR